MVCGAGLGQWQAELGASRLLARAGDRRLHLLDPVDTVLWDLHHQGWSLAAMADLLGARFALPPTEAAQQVHTRWQLWQQAGLLAAPAAPTPKPEWQLDQAGDPVWPMPCPRAQPPGSRRVVVADRHTALGCDNAAWQQQIYQALGPMAAAPPAPASAALVDHELQLQGDAQGWHLALDNATVAQGTGADAALVATISTLTELGCRPAERLMVVHGAGMVTPDGRGLLLVAPGGSGKTTLAAALDAAGFGLLSDDVVPVTEAGDLLGLGLPLCLKPGSWPVLQAIRPGLMTSPPVQRFGQTVRYLAPRHAAAGAVVPTACLLFSRYAPGQPAAHARISPEQALQGLIEAEAVLRRLTQPKIDALARWLNHAPAYTLSYPDLEAGIGLVRRLSQATAP